MNTIVYSPAKNTNNNLETSTIGIYFLISHSTFIRGKIKVRISVFLSHKLHLIHVLMPFDDQIQRQITVSVYHSSYKVHLNVYTCSSHLLIILFLVLLWNGRDRITILVSFFVSLIFFIHLIEINWIYSKRLLLLINNIITQYQTIKFIAFKVVLLILKSFIIRKINSVKLLTR